MVLVEVLDPDDDDEEDTQNGLKENPKENPNETPLLPAPRQPDTPPIRIHVNTRPPDPYAINRRRIPRQQRRLSMPHVNPHSPSQHRIIARPIGSRHHSRLRRSVPQRRRRRRRRNNQRSVRRLHGINRRHRRPIRSRHPNLNHPGNRLRIPHRRSINRRYSSHYRPESTGSSRHETRSP